MSETNDYKIIEYVKKNPHIFKGKFDTLSLLLNLKNNIEFNSEIDLINFLLYRKNEVSQLNNDVKYWKNTEFRYSILLNYINSILPVAVESEPLIIQNRMLLPYIDY